MKHFLTVVLSCLCIFFKITNGQDAATEPTCTEIGAFEIYDGTCKNYYICIDDGVNLNPIALSCATSFIFDSDQGRCVSESTITCQQTTTTTTTTATSLCLRYGRFPIQDVECKKYYLCYWNGVGYSIMNNLSCPNTLIFNPVKEKCVSPQTYNCLGTTN